MKCFFQEVPDGDEFTLPGNDRFVFRRNGSVVEEADASRGRLRFRQSTLQLNPLCMVEMKVHPKCRIVQAKKTVQRSRVGFTVPA
jgi:hypothetical protein